MTVPNIGTARPARGVLTTPRKPPLPSPPKKPDMNQYNHYHRAAVGNTLYRHFAHRPDVLVSGEGYLCFERSRIRSGWLEPDLVVAFGVVPDEISENNGYEAETEQDKVNAERGRRYKKALKLKRTGTG